MAIRGSGSHDGSAVHCQSKRHFFFKEGCSDPSNTLISTHLLPYVLYLVHHSLSLSFIHPSAAVRALLSDAVDDFGEGGREQQRVRAEQSITHTTALNASSLPLQLAAGGMTKKLWVTPGTFCCREAFKTRSILESIKLFLGLSCPGDASMSVRQASLPEL